jgi:ParB family transcriptional regulator, chromosome partitioning protein
MQLKTVKLSNLRAAPWRLTDEKPCQETKNVVASLDQHGQLRPILVRQLSGDHYQIIDGHVVVDAARKLGIPELDCVVHEVDEQKALLIYLHLKLNRTVVSHVKIRDAFKQVGDVEKIHQAICWPKARITAYLELSDRDGEWMKFGYVPNDDGRDDLQPFEL